MGESLIPVTMETDNPSQASDSEETEPFSDIEISYTKEEIVYTGEPFTKSTFAAGRDVIYIFSFDARNHICG